MPNTKESCTRCGATPETGQTVGCPECEGVVPPAKESGNYREAVARSVRSDVPSEWYLELVAERDALREALEALYVEVETSESIGICLPDRVPALRAGELLARERPE